MEYKIETCLFFKGQQTPKQTKKGDAYFHIVSKATKHKY